MDAAAIALIAEIVLARTMISNPLE